ncbi:hypothetical protein FACS189426_23630 [Bacteroidia bacterium]|nr:hypothetical protein FACS189426_23630 [Bacteroidia bacterium]
MKKQLFLLIGFLLATTPLFAQETVEKPSLVGIWQYCSPTANPFIKDSQTDELSLDTTVLRGNLTFKILGHSGDFSNMFLSSDFSQINACVNAYGTYEIVADSLYIEHITRSYSDPVYNGKKNRMPYHFFGNNYCVFSYTSPKNGGKAVEIWRRILGGIPAKTSQPQTEPKSPNPAKVN